MFTVLYKIGLLGCAVAFSMFGASPILAANNGTPMVGHYEGFINLGTDEDPNLELLSFTLHKGGTASIATDETVEDAIDGPVSLKQIVRKEHETVALGLWDRVGRNYVRIGALQFRVGNRICNAIDERDDNKCSLRLGISAYVDKDGNVDGFVRLVAEESGSTLILGEDRKLVDVRRTNLEDDFEFPPMP